MTECGGWSGWTGGRRTRVANVRCRRGGQGGGGRLGILSVEYREEKGELVGHGADDAAMKSHAFRGGYSVSVQFGCVTRSISTAGSPTQARFLEVEICWVRSGRTHGATEGSCAGLSQRCVYPKLDASSRMIR